MARFIEHQKALKLKKQGKSYSEIKKTLGISKSTLSDWLRKYPLTLRQMNKLNRNDEKRIERCRETKLKHKKERLFIAYKKQKDALFPLSKRDLFIAGLFLYWGEGSKSHSSNICISNTDPSVIKFFISWAKQSMNVPEHKLRAHLHLYSDMNIQKELKYWSTLLKIPLKQFYKSYIKKTSSKNIGHKGLFSHGTCNITINGVELTEKVLMSIKAIMDRYK